MTQQKTSIIVTSIGSPNVVLAEFAQKAQKHGFDFIVIGDLASPKTFALDGCRFYGLGEQVKLAFNFARLCPIQNYARKNIGYLIALAEGAEVIIETDDDNYPEIGFWDERVRKRDAPTLKNSGWINVYRYFSDANIWPRGLPLVEVRSLPPPLGTVQTMKSDCPIQQGLVDGNPDVDAIYRLILPLPLKFAKNICVTLASGSWSPFNSQNTTWWKDAAPLMYLPSYCSFRVADIWRSLIAQRVAWENDWAIFYHSPTVLQNRNEHDLVRDFKDELPGYTNNSTIRDALVKLSLRKGLKSIPENMRQCYRMLAAMKIIEDQELQLLNAWLSDLDAI